MSVALLYTPCFVMFCVFLYGPFCHGAHKLDLSTLFTTFFEHLFHFNFNNKGSIQKVGYCARFEQQKNI